MGALWEPRPRGDGWWSTRLYRGEGAAPTKKAFMQTSSGRINKGEAFCGSPALGAMGRGLLKLVATQGFCGDVPVMQQLAATGTTD
ncbi:hypothetical protein B9Z48_04865 [Limnohabitans sp. WS1]|nr:hypothetical protein B9Z48_04865 [Limnohabitans sp. WS1]